MSNTYFNLKVAEITKETADTITLHLEQPTQERITYIPGQFLTLILPIKGSKVRRSYSLSSTTEEPHLSVTVKRVPGGLVSNYLLDNARVGQEIEIMAPLGNFNLPPDASQKRHIYLFGAGSGITPLMSMLKAVLTNEPQSRVTLVYGSRNEESVIFKDQLQKLEEQYPNRLAVEHVFSQPKSGQQGGGFGKLLGGLFGKKAAAQPSENVHKHTGRLNRSMILRILEERKAPEFTEELYYMCGPDGMMQEVQAALQMLKVPAEKIFKESFVTATAGAEEPNKGQTSVADSDEITTQTVTLIYEGTEYQVDVKPDTTILEAGLKADIDLPYSCQAGLCTACRGKAISGKVHLDEREGLSDTEIEQGYVLCCVGHPLTPDVVIEIG